MLSQGERIIGVKVPRGLMEEINKAVNEEGIFLSASDALRYGVRLALLLSKGSTILAQLAKESRKQIIDAHFQNI